MKHLILGNGPTGVIAAETLRKADRDCEIVMIGAEPEPPYSRMAIPYLLEGNIDESGTYLRKSTGHFTALRIENRIGVATAVDPSKKTVTFADGSSETYDKLLIATGSHPICPPIPGADLPHVHTCWTLADARAIASRATTGTRVLQLGAGFIGSIILEALAKRGVELTVVELGDRMVPRMMTPKAGAMIKHWVEAKGVRVLTNAKVERIDPINAEDPSLLTKLQGLFRQPSSDTASSAMLVTLSTGQVIECDLVILSAGVRPNVSFLEGSGVRVAQGVLTDRQMRSSVPDIFAAGDVAEAPDLFSGAPMVSAIQPNAADQARIAALNMVGKTVHHGGVMAINVLDTLGLISSSFGQWEGTAGGDSVEFADSDTSRYISLQFRDDVLIGATAIGLTQHVGVLRGLIQAQVSLGEWKHALLSDPFRAMDAYLASTQKPGVLNDQHHGHAQAVR
ncbi:MAG: NAD(P)/FAD-dependent oxidoreductase [Litorivicinaceae bacterium]